VQFRSDQRKEPLNPYEVPERAWQIVGSDIFEINKTYYVIVVDYYSNWFEYEAIKNITAGSVIQAMKRPFSRFRIPEKVYHGQRYSVRQQ